MSPHLAQIAAQQHTTELYAAAEHDRRFRPAVLGPAQPGRHQLATDGAAVKRLGRRARNVVHNGLIHAWLAARR